MFEIHLVKGLAQKDMIRFGRRVNTVSSTDTSSFGQNVFPLMKFGYTKVDKKFEIGITDRNYFTVPITLNYEITKAPYFVWKALALEELDKVNQALSEYKSQHIIMVEQDDSPFVVFQTEADDFTKYELERIKYYESVRNSLQEKIKQFDEEADQFNQKYGYGIIISLKTGNLGCDVKYIRLNSAEGILMLITHQNRYELARVYQFSERVLTLEEFNKENFNNNYLSNQTFTFFDLFRKPDVYVWCEVSFDGNRWFQIPETMKLIQLHGVKYGTVTEVNNDTGEVTIEDETGGIYFAKASDFSVLYPGMKIIVSRNGSNITLTPDYSAYYNINGENIQYTTSHNTLVWEDLES